MEYKRFVGKIAGVWVLRQRVCCYLKLGAFHGPPILLSLSESLPGVFSRTKRSNELTPVSLPALLWFPQLILKSHLALSLSLSLIKPVLDHLSFLKIPTFPE